MTKQFDSEWFRGWLDGRDVKATAKLLGVSRATVYNWANGKHPPRSMQALLRLSALAGVPVDWFYRLTN